MKLYDNITGVNHFLEKRLAYYRNIQHAAEEKNERAFHVNKKHVIRSIEEEKMLILESIALLKSNFTKILFTDSTISQYTFTKISHSINRLFANKENIEENYVNCIKDLKKVQLFDVQGVKHAVQMLKVMVNIFKNEKEILKAFIQEIYKNEELLLSREAHNKNQSRRALNVYAPLAILFLFGGLLSQNDVSLSIGVLTSMFLTWNVVKKSTDVSIANIRIREMLDFVRP